MLEQVHLVLHIVFTDQFGISRVPRETHEQELRNLKHAQDEFSVACCRLGYLIH